MTDHHGAPLPRPAALQAFAEGGQGRSSVGAWQPQTPIKLKFQVNPSKPSSSNKQENKNTKAVAMSSTGWSTSPKDANSRAESPVHPPYSPITPTMSSARLATTPTNPFTKEPQTKYTHHGQAPQTSIPPPQPVPIDFETNPDVIALKSTLSILLLQKKKAEDDLVRLHRMKKAGKEDPLGFANDLFAGKIKTDNSDGLINVLLAQGMTGPAEEATDDDEGEDDTDTAGGKGKAKGKAKAGKGGMSSDKTESKFGSFPAPQKIVKCPPINWAKYAVIGESLDKIHLDQVEHPTDSVFQFGAGGSGAPSISGGEAKKPPKVEKMSTRKGGKR